jgi:hypothetical protein
VSRINFTFGGELVSWVKVFRLELDCFGVQSVDTIGRCVQHVLIYWQGRRVCDALFVIIILLFVFVCVKLSGLPAIHDMMSAEEHVLSLPPSPKFRAWLENLTSQVQSFERLVSVRRERESERVSITFFLQSCISKRSHSFNFFYDITSRTSAAVSKPAEPNCNKTRQQEPETDKEKIAKL